jgi:chemosensory pili system protein ChpA (sensor histidine kinase/response regulator)
MLASGFLEALAGKHVPLSVHAKRVLSSLLSQLRVLVTRGQEVPSDRLASELLFFCAQASGDVPVRTSARCWRVCAAPLAWSVTRPVNLSVFQLGRYDPTWVTRPSSAWRVPRMAGLPWLRRVVATGWLERAVRAGGDSLRRLFRMAMCWPTALAEAVSKPWQRQVRPKPSLAMEVATSLLYVEASLEDGEFDQPEQQASHAASGRAHSDAVGKGQPPSPLEGWMEDLYRRVSDRQTIGSVVAGVAHHAERSRKAHRPVLP